MQVAIIWAYFWPEQTGIGQVTSEFASFLSETVANVAGKRVSCRYVDGTIGVQSRNFSNAKIYSIGWKPRYSLRDGIAKTYAWIAEKVCTDGSLRG